MELHPFITNRWFKNIGNQQLIDNWKYTEKYFAYMPIKNTKSIFLGSFPIWQISIGNVTQDNFEFLV